MMSSRGLQPSGSKKESAGAMALPTVSRFWRLSIRGGFSWDGSQDHRQQRNFNAGSRQSVINFVNDRLLTSDVDEILAKLSPGAEIRYSHYVPPGFQDKKPENRYGDLIIWEELIADVAAAQLTRSGKARVRGQVTTAVLISRDKKTDWVSAAHMVRNDVKPLIRKSNRDEDMDVTLPHPLLLHEFQRRAGAKKLYVTHPAFLSSVLDFSARRRSEASPAKAWLKATHRPDFGVMVETRLEALSQRRRSLRLLCRSHQSAPSNWKP